MTMPRHRTEVRTMETLKVSAPMDHTRPPLNARTVVEVMQRTGVDGQVYEGTTVQAGQRYQYVEAALWGPIAAEQLFTALEDMYDGRLIRHHIDRPVKLHTGTEG